LIHRCSLTTRSSLRTATVKRRQRPTCHSTSVKSVINWHGIDIDAFAADLELSTLVVAPPDDVATTFDYHNTTLLSLLNKHAPLKLKRVNTRHQLAGTTTTVAPPSGRLEQSKEGIFVYVLMSRWRHGAISFSLNVAYSNRTSHRSGCQQLRFTTITHKLFGEQ